MSEHMSEPGNYWVQPARQRLWHYTPSGHGSRAACGRMCNKIADVEKVPPRLDRTPMCENCQRDERAALSLKGGRPG